MTTTPPAPTLRLAVQMLLAALLAPVAVGVALHLWPAAASWARHAVPLSFTPARVGGLASLWVTNLRAVAKPVLIAAVLTALGPTVQPGAIGRALLDVIVALGALLNLANLATAVTGYGPARLLPWVPQLPFELGALTIATAAYVHASRGRSNARSLALHIALCLAALTVAAVIETYAVPHR